MTTPGAADLIPSSRPGARGFSVDGSAGFGRLSHVTAEQDRRYYAITVRPRMFVNLVPDIAGQEPS